MWHHGHFGTHFPGQKPVYYRQRRFNHFFISQSLPEFKDAISRLRIQQEYFSIYLHLSHDLDNITIVYDPLYFL